MKEKSTIVFLTAVFAVMLATSTHATTYPGNGNTGFGGPIGNGSLTLSDDGTTISGTFTLGAGSFNDSLVIYVDSVGTGFPDTSMFADAFDGLRSAISGFDGTNRSTLTFASGFAPQYAIALGPANSTFGGLWSLANGGNNSLGFVSSVSLSPTGTNNSPTYTFSFTLAQIGLTPNSGQSFDLFGTYISNSGFRSTEAIAGDATGTQGWNPFTQTSFGTYTTVPEPSIFALVGMAMAGLALIRRLG